jgi:hypothetical protein
MALWSALLSKPTRTPLAARPSLTLFFLVAGAFLLTLVPHVLQFPVWLSITVISAMVIRSIIEVYRLPLPSTTFCGIMALVLLGVILAWFKTVLGRDAGTAFTAGLLTIKFYELRGPRDVALIIFSCFFIVMSALIYSQVLELFVYCLIMMWVLTALLLRVHTGDLPEDRLLLMLRKSGVIFLQALPLALFLFLVFPRFPGPIGLPPDEASIGLSDTVTPGSIAKLAQNDDEAMYVQFTSLDAPTPEAMYWRALVLWDYQYGAWTAGKLASSPHAKPVAGVGSDQFVQEITIQPHHQKWLFALDTPITAAVNPAETADQPFWSTFCNGNILQLTAGRLDHRTRYDVTSATTLADESITETEIDYGTRLPESRYDQINPWVKSLADDLHYGLSDGQDLEYIHAVLKYFRHGGFVYSSSPGIQGPDWLPVFLFTTKTGFCEHFASAFAVLMRLEHIPTRLVVGYQGAEYNPYSDRYTVYQSNAHAWDEVWIRAKGQPASGRLGHWLRVDPTAILTATEGGQMANAADPGDAMSIQVAPRSLTFAETFLPVWMQETLKSAQLRREEVETQWDNLVFSYDPEAQSRLAEALGFGEKANFQLLLACVIASGICFFVFKRWMTRKPLVSPVENLYASFCQNMTHRGIPRAVWEGPLAYTERVAEAFPDEKQAIRQVGSIVANVRYGPSPPDTAASQDLKTLLTAITASQAAKSSRDRP